jgi:hypothetical protein
MGQDRCCRTIPELPPFFRNRCPEKCPTKLKENVKNPFCIEGRNVRFSVQLGTSINDEILTIRVIAPNKNCFGQQIDFR